MKKYFVLLIAITFSLSFAQKAQLNKGDKNFNNFSYIQAIKIYKKVAAKGYKSKELYQRIADSYYFNADYINASSWYEKLFKIDPAPLNHNYYFRFSLAAIRKSYPGMLSIHGLPYFQLLDLNGNPLSVVNQVYSMV